MEKCDNLWKKTTAPVGVGGKRGEQGGVLRVEKEKTGRTSSFRQTGQLGR